MFFFLRCAFCLMIVFYWMPWQTPLPRDQQSRSHEERLRDEHSKEDHMPKVAVSTSAADLMTAAGNSAIAKLEETCAKARAECLANAAKLAQMGAEMMDLLPPKRPMRFNEKETHRPGSGHMPASHD